MKLTLGTAWTIVSTTLVIGYGGYKIFFENKQENKEQDKAIVEIKETIKNDVLPILNHIHESADSANINAKKALEIGRTNMRCNIEISKQLKGFDILKFYDPFMMWNKAIIPADSIPKKNLPSSLMYTNKLQDQ